MNELNKERREVARKLREDAADDKLREQVFVEEIIVGCIGETMHDEWGNVREIEILTRLAELIDRPTCKPKDRGRGYVDAVCDSFWCPNCSFEIDVHIGEDQHLTEAAKYCPNCGAEVIDE